MAKITLAEMYQVRRPSAWLMIEITLAEMYAFHLSLYCLYYYFIPDCNKKSMRKKRHSVVFVRTFIALSKITIHLETLYATSCKGLPR